MIGKVTIPGTNEVYVGGTFTTVNGKPMNYISLWNGTQFLNLEQGCPSFVRSLSVFGKCVIVVGKSLLRGLFRYCNSFKYKNISCCRDRWLVQSVGMQRHDHFTELNYTRWQTTGTTRTTGTTGTTGTTRTTGTSGSTGTTGTTEPTTGTTGTTGLYTCYWIFDLNYFHYLSNVRVVFSVFIG